MHTGKQRRVPSGRALTLELLRYFKTRAESQPPHTIAIRYAKGTVYRRVHEAQRIGYLAKGPNGHRLTAKGARVLSEERVWGLKINTPARWDRKWHLVLFDIPTRRKKYRDILRLRLKELGFVLYQNSVWVYPYPPEDTVRQIATFYFIDKYVSFAVVEKLTGEKNLLKEFHLS